MIVLRESRASSFPMEGLSLRTKTHRSTQVCTWAELRLDNQMGSFAENRSCLPSSGTKRPKCNRSFFAVNDAMKGGNMVHRLATWCGGKAALLLTACLLSACTHFQERTLHRFSGVVLDAETEKPVAGAVLVLQELRAPLIPIPFGLPFWRTIAHTTTAPDGTFEFRVCMVAHRSYGGASLHVDYGHSSPAPRNPEWSGTKDDVRVRFFVPRLREPLDHLIEDEDSSFTRVCM